MSEGAVRDFKMLIICKLGRRENEAVNHIRNGRGDHSGSELRACLGLGDTLNLSKSKLRGQGS